MIRELVFCLSVLASPAIAELKKSVRPVARSTTETLIVPPTVPAVQTAAQVSGVVLVPGAVSLRPLLRPRVIEEKAMARKRERARGSICNDPDIQGSQVGAVPGRLRGCGLSDAVKVREVAGVALSQQAIMNCQTAKSLKTWVARSAKPALRDQGGGLVSMRVAAHYSCRTRNNLPGGKISEHGKGKAIDLSAFTLANGKQITVLNGWGRGQDGRALRKMHAGACGPFGTVLGPEADRFHRDHFHFDTANHRGGSFCR
ncbi:MAG: extensin family protein [Paracoccaceae bacterium]